MNLKPEALGFMLHIKGTSFLTPVILFLFLNSTVIFAAEQDNKVSMAFELFDTGNYSAAEPIFKSLIDEKPELLMLYYYYGACRTENKNYSEYDLIQLLNANPNEAPAKINYYLGIQYQALNNWEQALKYFNKFKLNSSSGEQTELKIAEKIQQCFDKQNPYSEFVIQQEKEIQKDTISNIRISAETEPDLKNYDPIEIDTFETAEIYTDTINLETDTFELPSEIEYTIEIPENTEIQSGNQIEFRINSQIKYFNTDNFQTDEGKQFFEKGELKQKELDSTLKKIEEFRNEYLLTKNSADKNIIGEKILASENESYQLKEEVTQFFFQAQNTENSYWENATSEEIENFTQEIENAETNKIKRPEQDNQINETDETPLISPSILFGNEKEVKTDDKSKNDELIYKIQIGAFSRGLPSYIDRLFKKLSLIRKIEKYTDEKGVVVYTTGNLTNMEDALQMQKQVKQEGVEDAYVVPYFNGKRITLEQAKKLEGGL